MRKPQRRLLGALLSLLAPMIFLVAPASSVGAVVAAPFHCYGCSHECPQDCEAVGCSGDTLDCPSDEVIGCEGGHVGWKCGAA